MKKTMSTTATPRMQTSATLHGSTRDRAPRPRDRVTHSPITHATSEKEEMKERRRFVGQRGKSKMYQTRRCTRSSVLLCFTCDYGQDGDCSWRGWVRKWWRPQEASVQFFDLQVCIFWWTFLVPCLQSEIYVKHKMRIFKLNILCKGCRRINKSFSTSVLKCIWPRVCRQTESRWTSFPPRPPSQRAEPWWLKRKKKQRIQSNSKFINLNTCAQTPEEQLEHLYLPQLQMIS